MAPQHAIFIDTATKFVVGAGFGAGIMWKLSNMAGGSAHDIEYLGDGAKAPAKAKEAESLLRRHSTQTNIKTMGGEHHPEAVALKPLGTVQRGQSVVLNLES